MKEFLWQTCDMIGNVHVILLLLLLSCTLLVLESLSVKYYLLRNERVFSSAFLGLGEVMPGLS